VIPARANIRKSSKLLDLVTEPTVALPPYQKLKDTGTVLPGMDFSKEQKDKIYKANKAFYKKGDIVSDDDGKPFWKSMTRRRSLMSITSLREPRAEPTTTSTRE